MIQKLKRLGRYWMVIAGVLIGAAGGLVYGLVTPTTYTATSVLFLASPASTDSNGAYQGDLFSQQRATTYVQLFGSDDLAVKVIDDLSLKTTPAELKKKVAATQIPKTVLLDVSVKDESAQRATDIANAYGSNFNDYVQRLEVPRVTGTPTASINVMNKAEVPTEPSSIGLPIAIAVGVGAGLVAGMAASYAWRRWRRFLKKSTGSTDQTESTTAKDDGAAGDVPVAGAERDQETTALSGHVNGTVELPTNSGEYLTSRHRQ